MVECLTSAGCSLQASNKEGESPLHVAAVRGYYGIVRFLSENGAQLDLRDKVARCADWVVPRLSTDTQNCASFCVFVESLGTSPCLSTVNGILTLYTL